MSELEPMTTVEVEWLRKRHYLDDDGPYCHWCDQDWPCNVARLIATLQESRDAMGRALSTAREMLEVLNGVTDAALARSVLPPLTPIPGLEISSVNDLMRPEEHARLVAALREDARSRRRGAAAAGTIPMGSSGGHLSPRLRDLLWSLCPHTMKYGDDGRRDCGFTDFNTERLAVLLTHIEDARMEQAAGRNPNG